MKKIFNIISLCILLCSGVYAGENPPPKLYGITLFENMDKIEKYCSENPKECE